MQTEWQSESDNKVERTGDPKRVEMWLVEGRSVVELVPLEFADRLHSLWNAMREALNGTCRIAITRNQVRVGGQDSRTLSMEHAIEEVVRLVEESRKWRSDDEARYSEKEVEEDLAHEAADWLAAVTGCDDLPDHLGSWLPGRLQDVERMYANAGSGNPCRSVILAIRSTACGIANEWFTRRGLLVQLRDHGMPDLAPLLAFEHSYSDKRIGEFREYMADLKELLDRGATVDLLKLVRDELEQFFRDAMRDREG